MKTISVDLGERTYPIYIGCGLLGGAPLLKSYATSQQVMIVTNDCVAPLYLSKVEQLFSGYHCNTVVLPDGERYKTLETINKIFDALLSNKHNRTTTLVALGGGVIGDMTGFAAACYQRGVSFIQIPTTLLAQVDSSVGGKTGVNHPLGKNMIGAFHQPSCVLIDVDTLNTLPDREYRAGMAEVIKYGLINDSDFFEWLLANVDALFRRDAGALIYAIQRSCANKARIVAADEKETGIRAWLNLGHTFGHAIEAWQAYKGFLHGEAVAIGMVLAAELSVQLGLLSPSCAERIVALLLRLELPVVQPEGMDAAAFIEFMQRDKKVLNGNLRFVLLDAIGSAVIRDDVPVEKVISAIDACRQRAVAVG
ncbi:MAG: 3-dehydroquinate synthase [Pseudomonadales bacterium]|nr:3-dehydroquinate synthase [Pseudomonadales bacterium]